MAILKVARLGHPVLRQKSKDVSKDWWRAPESKQFIQDLVETMREYQGVGLAAPQVHRAIRVAVVEPTPNDRYPDAPQSALHVLINPKILVRGKEEESDWEGCLSVPDLRGRVPRAALIEVSAMDESGKERTIKADGFLARALQHELDHLDGKVYLDRMPDLSTLAYLEEYSRFHEEE